MSESCVDIINNFYEGRHVFCTGATGMLGTAYLSRLVMDTSITCVYAAVRGGESHLWDTWNKHLPPDMVGSLRLSGKLVIWDGDITKPDCGLTADQITVIQEKVSIFVHGASTINLQMPLAVAAQHIIYPSHMLAKIALSCVNLTRFIYISTAYAAAFIQKTRDGSMERCDAVIKEEMIHPIRGGSRSAAIELSDLETYGTTPEYEFVRYPFPYSYAKHLTERLLFELLSEAGLEQTLLIFRPSCIGPAESKPYPFYEIPGSSPVTTAMAAIIANTPTRMQFSSHLPDPSAAAVDEAPVDTVVNRLIAHVAFESTGYVHAVGGSMGRRPTEEWFDAAVQLRRHGWGSPKLVWCNDHWKSDRLCLPARLFVITGCSFIFDEAKTELIWNRMSLSERLMWPLWQCKNVSTAKIVAGRENAIMLLVGRMFSRAYGLPTSSNLWPSKI